MSKRFKRSNEPVRMPLLNTGTQALEHVLKVVDAGMAAACVVAAAKAKVFDEFKDGVQSVESVAARRSWNPARTERMLNALASTKMLDRQENNNKVEYSLTSSGRYLVSDGPGTIHEYVANFTSMFYGEMDSVVTKYLDKDFVPDSTMADTPAGEHGHSHGQGDEEKGKYGLDEYNEKRTYETMQNLLLPGLDKMLNAVDLSKYQTCIDLGGGTCAVAKALTRLNPQMSVTVIEMDSVVKIAKEHFLTGQEERVEIIEGDFFKGDIPNADLYVLSKVMHHWTPEQLDKMMKKLFNAINPGGALMFFEWCLYDNKDGPNTMAHTWDIMCLGDEGACYSGKEYKEMMEKYGFTKFQLYRTADSFHYDIIFAEKP